MSKSHKPFTWPVRVYYQDTDAGGVVYHTNYVNFMERARTEWLRTFGHSNAGLMQEFGVMFVVRSIKIDYLKPALLDDMLEVTAHLHKVGRSQMTLAQEVKRGGEILTQADVHLVCVGRDSFKPVSVPEMLRKQWD
ncbi:MAG: tol-pal system-associated acyl-CoA thioesterase [Gammaproteobacteria bacterium]|nr:tol-pal system-associated acyl-CoA thioesterase [Gammaproteobacteria bacterium]MDD2929556.1 tol-pal system-associated acyl-CoA thioesterase [Sideroxydans sp.]